MSVLKPQVKAKTPVILTLYLMEASFLTHKKLTQMGTIRIKGLELLSQGNILEKLASLIMINQGQ